jgi:hypothetical protein
VSLTRKEKEVRAPLWDRQTVIESTGQPDRL